MNYGIHTSLKVVEFYQCKIYPRIPQHCFHLLIECIVLSMIYVHYVEYRLSIL